ncbi:hypothetical protein AB9P05_08715 [Roseivirga sp. BDSF3-8]|uniref:hypothetical protein n=1 Tax=Roseivirga sp. BDSF3-8 TaxID=3241598 RepID=UPI00353270D7
MIYRIALTYLFCLTGVAGFAQKFTPVEVEDQRITLYMPESMNPATAEDLRQKYVSSHPPLILYTSQDRQADLGVNTAPTPWAAGDLDLLKDIYKSNLQNLYDDVTFMKDTIVNRDGRDYIILEFVGTLNPEENTLTQQSVLKKYQYLMYTIRDYQVLMFFFIAPESQAEIWGDRVEASMEKVKIRDKKK